MQTKYLKHITILKLWTQISMQSRYSTMFHLLKNSKDQIQFWLQEKGNLNMLITLCS